MDLDKFRVISHPVFTVVSSMFIALSMAYIVPYNNELEYKKVQDAATFLAYIFTNPIAGLIVFGILFLLNEFIKHRISKVDQNLKTLYSENKKKLQDYVEQLTQNQSKLAEKQEDIVLMWLKLMSKAIDLGNDSRITILYHYNNQFTVMSRYSANPTLRNVVKPVFELSDGVISEVWEKGHLFDIACPCSVNDLESYKSYMEETYKYPITQISDFVMKSSRFAGIAIKDKDEHIGVILCESKDVGDIDDEKEEIFYNFYNENRDYCVDFIKEAIKNDRSIKVNKNATADNESANFILKGGNNE